MSKGLTFPARYTINVIRDTETGEQYVTAVRTSNQKVDLKNIKYSNVHHISFHNTKRVALLGVYDFRTEDELKDHLVYYGEQWEVKVDASNP